MVGKPNVRNVDFRMYFCVDSLVTRDHIGAQFENDCHQFGVSSEKDVISFERCVRLRWL